MPAPARVRVRAAAVVVGVGLMVLVPITKLDDQRPAPLGWHMYAGNVAPPEIEVTLQGGNTELRSMWDVAAKVRPEPDYFEPAARFICTKEPDVQSVRLTRSYPSSIQEFACDRF